MLWVDEQWIQRLSEEELARAALAYFAAAGLQVKDDAKLRHVCRVLQKRSKTLVELVQQARVYYAPIQLDPKARDKFLTQDSKPLLQAVRDGIAAMTPPDEAQLERAFQRVAEGRGLGLGKVAQPARVALTGGTASPGIYDVVLILGKEEALARLDAALGLIR
jgi:glutamyl-tRNA synthetase